MKIFHCSHCQHLVFFENSQCVHCGRQLAYSPAQRAMLAVGEDAHDPDSESPEAGVRLCQNYVDHAICNWAVDEGDPDPLCISCRLTKVIPPLDRADVVALWQRAEAAKRRLIVNLLALGLPVEDSTPGAGDGLRFEFKEPQPGESVLTGHQEGTITLNVREADDVLREQIRAQFAELYRTVLGHLRHESGHYYWDRLIRDGGRLDEFRAVFGDESIDYQNALNHHYQNGPVEDWTTEFISAYASVHPWEDWAETWAHYLHMADTLET
ncbi:MAG: putative zinc-binding peptidase, partial [Burkholderiaceae bacterium]